jgi:uncharacterized protein YhaN
MADNAIDKLIKEMRDAKTALDAALEAAEEAEKRRRDAREEVKKAKVRCDMLDLTMKKHIHENMPVVQAKMIAHEEIEQIQAADTSFTINAVSRASLSSAQLASASAAINAQLVSITKWYAGRNNGSLNLSI